MEFELSLWRELKARAEELNKLIARERRLVYLEQWTGSREGGNRYSQPCQPDTRLIDDLLDQREREVLAPARQAGWAAILFLP